MKKIIAVVLLVMFLMPTVAESAVDYKSMTDEELFEIMSSVVNELYDRRQTPTYDLMPGTYFAGRDLVPGKYKIVFYELTNASYGITGKPLGHFEVYDSFEKMHEGAFGTYRIWENATFEAQNFFELDDDDVLLITDAKAFVTCLMPD